MLRQTGLSRHLEFLTAGHSDAQGWASECPDVKNYKWWLNQVWHGMLYSCTHMATAGIRGLSGTTTGHAWYADNGWMCLGDVFRLAGPRTCVCDSSIVWTVSLSVITLSFWWR